jgi:acyl-CoA dehydrogenase
MSDHHAPHTVGSAFEGLLQKVHALGREVQSVHAADVDGQARFPREAIDALKHAKLLCAYVPKELGDMGLDSTQSA